MSATGAYVQDGNAARGAAAQGRSGRNWRKEAGAPARGLPTLKPQAP
jgi:hypothetical protein